ncbi:MAG: NUDIX hydrolase [Acidimicrobiales bacterium]
MNEVERLRRAVGSHHPADERESASCATMLAELERLERPFDGDADRTHVTGSGIVVGPRGVVLHKHRRLSRWMQPGGHVEPGESPADAAVRECAEETGLEVQHPPEGPAMVHVDVHQASKGHVHLDVRYLLLARDEDPAPPPEESQEVAWFSWDEALDMADDALRGALCTARRVFDAPAGSAGAMPGSAGATTRRTDPAATERTGDG